MKTSLLRSTLFVAVLLGSLACMQCVKSGAALPPATQPTCFYNGVDTCHDEPETILLQVHPDAVQQTIHSFGASDCWTTKFIGTWADSKKKNRIADLLFSLDTLQDGSPLGIGLSLWRFNIGAGSFEQGDSGDIATDWRREECFLNEDGSYDWDKQAGQQWFLRAARQRGVKYTLGFAISPPVYMTRNHKAFSAGGTSLNIQPGRLEDYAHFLAQVAEHFHFDYLSPVNEPQWDWKAGTNGKASQEGSPAQNGQISDLVELLSQQLEAAGADAKVIVGEAGQWDFLYSRNTDGRGDQVAQFFLSSSPHFIGDLPHVVHAISAHSYFTTCPDDNLVSVRQKVAARVKEVDPTLETWQTEFGVLGNICDQYSGAPRHTDMDYGLYVAKVIHHDLTVANVSSWQWWLAVNPYNYSDGLVYINDPSGNINVDNCKEDGIVLDSRQLWALGNYARFIRPGMQRITVTAAGYEDPVKAASSFMVSAYRDPTDKHLVLVVVNMDEKQRILQLSGVDGLQGSSLNAYTTDATHNLKKSVMAADSLMIPPRSVVTLTGSY